jgi:hypothetical protein
VPPLFAAIGPILAAIGGGSALAGGATLASLGAAGVGIGEEIANKPGGGPSAPTAAQQAASVAQQQNSLKATVANQAPNYQAEAEGGLSPGYIANQIGNTTGTGANISSLQDLVKQFTGGGGGGGGGTNLPQGQIGDSVSSAPDSKGLTDLTQYLQAA